MLILLFYFILFLTSSPSSSSATTPNAYDVLRSNGLPIGLLPKGIRDFSIDANGRFNASLNAPCTAKFESEVRYNATVGGIISLGQIAGLSGVAAQDLFLWFPVLAIRLDNDTSGIIHFDVGVVNKSYPASLFEVPPCCSPVSSSAVADARLRESYGIAQVEPEDQLWNLRDKMDQNEPERTADI